MKFVSSQRGRQDEVLKVTLFGARDIVPCAFVCVGRKLALLCILDFLPCWPFLNLSAIWLFMPTKHCGALWARGVSSYCVTVSFLTVDLITKGNAHMRNTYANKVSTSVVSSLPFPCHFLTFALEQCTVLGKINKKQSYWQILRRSNRKISTHKSLTHNDCVAWIVSYNPTYTSISRIYILNYFLIITSWAPLWRLHLTFDIECDNKISNLSFTMWFFYLCNMQHLMDLDN